MINLRFRLRILRILRILNGGFFNPGTLLLINSSFATNPGTFIRSCATLVDLGFTFRVYHSRAYLCRRGPNTILATVSIHKFRNRNSHYITFSATILLKKSKFKKNVQPVYQLYASCHTIYIQCLAYSFLFHFRYRTQLCTVHYLVRCEPKPQGGGGR